MVSVCCAAGAELVHRQTPSASAPAGADLVLAVAFPVVAGVILASQPRNLVGWLLLSSAAMGPYLLAGQYAAHTDSSPTPVTALAAWYSIWGFAPYFVLWVLTPMHFPDGRLPSDRWVPIRRVLVGLLVVLVTARMFAPVDSDVSDRVSNPLGLHGGVWLDVVTLVVSVLLEVLGAVAGVAAVVGRWRPSGGHERRRLRWLLLGVGWLALCNMAGLALMPLGRPSDPWLAAGMLGLVGALGIGVVRHRLFDVRDGLRRSIATTVLVVLLAAASVAVLAATGAKQQPERLALTTIAVVCLLAAAAHEQLQHLADRVMFGQRQDPDAVMTSLRRRLDLATGPLDALGQLADGLQERLRLPYVRIDAAIGQLPPVVAGEPVSHTLVLEVVEAGDVVGGLTVGLRDRDERPTGRDRKALETVAHQIGAQLRQAALSAEVQAQRELVVGARENERRRIRRDLHDGVGPALAGVAMQLDQLAARLDDEPELADRAREARDELRATVGSVRRLVDGLRPPALDDVGLTGALANLLAPYGERVRLHVAPLPVLPAATEAAAYLIGGEAASNALRHSGCRTCALELEPDPPWLVVTVTDDGSGIPVGAPQGVGLTSMRDRAAEVGGLLEVVTSPQGTEVRARLPLETRG